MIKVRHLKIIWLGSPHSVKKDGKPEENTEESNKYYLWCRKCISVDDTLQLTPLSLSKKILRGVLTTTYNYYRDQVLKVSGTISF